MEPPKSPPVADGMCGHVCAYVRVCTCVCVNGIVFSHERKEIMPFVRIWMNLDGSIPSEMS